MIRIVLLSLMLFPLCSLNKLYAQSGTMATDGIYVPRLTSAQRNALPTPTEGQMIYNTDDNCFNLYQNDTWQKLCGYNMEVSTSDSWFKKADFGGTARQDAVGFAIGNKGYIGTGGSSGLSDFWEYDPATNVWTQKANFGGGNRRGAVGFSIGNKGYIGTGSQSSTAKSDFWEYNPASNVWTQKADVGGGIRTNAVGFSISNKGYIGTGTSKEDFWEYDTTANVWSQKANFGGGIRSSAVGFSVSSRGYIGTGSVGSTRTVDFWEYNPATDVWTQKANFGGSARHSAAGFVISNKGYIGTGNDGATQDDLWEYSPVTNTWTERNDFGRTGRADAVGFAVNNKGYIGTGYAPDRSGDNQPAGDFWEYTPNITSLSINGDITVGGKLNRSIQSFQFPILQNNWVRYSTAYSEAAYYKDNESVVHLKGFLKNGVTTQNTILFTLPLGYRPTEIRVFTVASGDGTFGRIDVHPNGNVQFYSGVNTYLSLDGISFRVD
ncbi:Kelch repeat-containing protein [Emticicia soli]|uniref:Kelch repeat-containing protein n=1 Tax=Emticicia soli TaxID=2027878 RepID=A0ABW5JA12_9BACT